MWANPFQRYVLKKCLPFFVLSGLSSSWGSCLSSGTSWSWESIICNWLFGLFVSNITLVSINSPSFVPNTSNKLYRNFSLDLQEKLKISILLKTAKKTGKCVHELMDFIRDLKRISFECFQKVDFITSDSINIKLKYVLNDFLANYPQRKYSEKVQSIFIM